MCPNIIVRIENDRLSFYFLYFLLDFIIDYKTEKMQCDTITGHISHMLT